MRISLQEIQSIKNWPSDFHGDPELAKRSVRGVSIDSRTIKAQELYFALRGDTHDGHNFIKEIFEKEAAAAVVERDWWLSQGERKTKPVFVVDNTLTALQKLAEVYRPRFTIPVVALTGTNGKTTTKEMLAAVLSKAGQVCKTQGNLNNHIGVPLTLLRMTEADKFMVVEMGANHFGEIALLCKIADPDCGLITNIGHGHLEFFGSLEGVAKAKVELFEHLRTKGTAFVNLDDPLIVKYAPKMKHRIGYGFKDEAKVFGTTLEPDSQGRARMKVEGETVRLNLVGDHNLSNALAAVAVGLEFGITMKDIKTALENVQMPDKRLQIQRHGKLLIINDSYNANPDSTLAALKLLKQTETSGKRIFVFGDMLELGELAASEHQKIGEALPTFNVDVLYAFGPESLATVKSARVADPKMVAEHFSDKDQLARRLHEITEDKDVLLVKGSRGMKMEEVISSLSTRR